MFIYFPDYKKSFENFYMNKNGGKIMIDVKKDYFKYNSNVSESDVLKFQKRYKIGLARELEVKKMGNLENLLDSPKV
jgi:hypothetical protein